jgi:hypothetical protein
MLTGTVPELAPLQTVGTRTIAGQVVAIA